MTPDDHSSLRDDRVSQGRTGDETEMNDGSRFVVRVGTSIGESSPVTPAPAGGVAHRLSRRVESTPRGIIREARRRHQTSLGHELGARRSDGSWVPTSASRRLPTVDSTPTLLARLGVNVAVPSHVGADDETRRDETRRVVFMMSMAKYLTTPSSPSNFRLGKLKGTL